MENYYKPTDNPTLKNYQFRSLAQNHHETFPAFCNRVAMEAKHCNFKCNDAACTAGNVAIRDQIVICTNNKDIREDALLKSWDLATLRTEGMKYESAQKGGAEIAGEQINRVGQYSYKKLKEKENMSENKRRTLTCFYCGNQFTTSIIAHKQCCPARDAKCHGCQKTGHFENVCKSKKSASQTKTPANPEEENANQTYNVNIYQIRKSERMPKPKMLSNATNKNDFKVEIVVHNQLVTVIADTGAKISVCGTVQAAKWGLLSKMTPSKATIKPYQSPTIPVHGIAKSAATFGNTSIPVDWHIISGSCEPILAGNAAVELGIIKFTKLADTFHPVRMIGIECDPLHKESIQSILAQYPQNFTGIGKLKNHQVKLHVDPTVKPIAVPPRNTPYHLQERVKTAIDEMVKQDIIEEHPSDQPAPWTSCAVIVPKPDGGLRVTLDARNVNKALRSTNLPIPRVEDIKAKMSGAKVFSKLDFKTAFWQIEIEPNSRYLTVFHSNNKLYRYKRLTMGLEPSQGELNNALKLLFSHIAHTHLIHDDIIIAAPTTAEHDEALLQIMITCAKHGLTLNPSKCKFGETEIKFWGMLISENGVRPDPAKVDALKAIRPPTNKQDLISFLCMMQSNSEFIPNFAQKASILRELTKVDSKYEWTSRHQNCFTNLIAEFRKSTQLQFFDMSKPTYVIVDAHNTGIGAILAQGDSPQSAKPVALASRTTSAAEKRYPQLDLEALAVDFGLRRFRNYLIGAPDTITVITDHKPLCPIFNGNRSGSFRTERIKLRHQEIRFSVQFQPGRDNQADTLSRNAKDISKLPLHEQNEAEDLNNLLYVLHSTPLMDRISIASIANATSEDETLNQLRTIILKGQTWIPNTAAQSLQRYRSILPEITVTANGILCKGDRLILPSSLQSLAIKLCHQGSHPGQSAMQRRLRTHFSSTT